MRSIVLKNRSPKIPVIEQNLNLALVTLCVRERERAGVNKLPREKNV